MTDIKSIEDLQKEYNKYIELTSKNELEKQIEQLAGYEKKAEEFKAEHLFEKIKREKEKVEQLKEFLDKNKDDELAQKIVNLMNENKGSAIELTDYILKEVNPKSQDPKLKESIRGLVLQLSRKISPDKMKEILQAEMDKSFNVASVGNTITVDNTAKVNNIITVLKNELGNKKQNNEKSTEQNKEENKEQNNDGQSSGKVEIKNIKQVHKPITRTRQREEQEKLQIKGANQVIQQKNNDTLDQIIEGISFEEYTALDNSKGDCIFFDENNSQIEKTSILSKNEFEEISKIANKMVFEKEEGVENSFDKKEGDLSKIVEDKMREKGAESGAVALISPIDKNNPNKKQLDCLIIGKPNIKIHLHVSLNGVKETWTLDPETQKLTNEKGEEIDKTKLTNIKIPDFSRKQEISKIQEVEKETEKSDKELDKNPLAGIGVQKSDNSQITQEGSFIEQAKANALKNKENSKELFI